MKSDLSIEDKIGHLSDDLHVLTMALWGAASAAIEPSTEAKEALAGYAGNLALKAGSLALDASK